MPRTGRDRVESYLLSPLIVLGHIGHGLCHAYRLVSEGACRAYRNPSIVERGQRGIGTYQMGESLRQTHGLVFQLETRMQDMGGFSVPPFLVPMRGSTKSYAVSPELDAADVCLREETTAE